MAATIQDLLRERKYPFLSSFFFILFVFFLAVLLLTSNRYTTNEHNRQFSIASSTISSPSPPFQRSNNFSSPIQKPKPAVDFNSNAPYSSSQINSSNGKNNIEKIEIQWKVCGGVLASDYIPCLDNMKAIKALTTRRHMEHRERHCPKPSPRCLTPLPRGYKLPVLWPKSRDMIWYDNVPHPKLVDYKKGQNWVQRSGDYFVFPGGGTQFKDGVIKYVEFIEETLTTIKWGQHTRVILDVGCGVASFGGYLLDKGVITMSFAPKDEHEAQIQFALERGIPATLSVIGTQRLTFPDNAYDLIHCARCRVHWDANGGKPLLELNRILRPGGLFVWSATPVYRDDKRDLSVWNAMVALTESICWKAVAKTVDSSGIGLVIYQKPVSNACYEGRKENVPPLCEQKDNHNASWYVPLGSCLHKLSSKELDWPAPWPERLISKPPNLAMEPEALKIYYEDTKHWSVFVSEVYMGGLSVNWSGIRNVMDMNAGYGGFAAAVVDKPVWVMNVVPPPTSVEEEDSLGVIFDRGLIGIYHDWCESFNTYPRTYDLLHANYLFRNLRCEIVDVAVEMDRILRPGGWVLVRDNNMDTINKLTSLLHSLHWETSFYHPQNHLLLVARKTLWRPNPIPTTTTHHRRS